MGELGGGVTVARLTSRLQELSIVAFAYLCTCSLSEQCGSEGNKGRRDECKVSEAAAGGDARRWRVGDNKASFA